MSNLTFSVFFCFEASEGQGLLPEASLFSDARTSTTLSAGGEKSGPEQFLPGPRLDAHSNTEGMVNTRIKVATYHQRPRIMVETTADIPE